jgi:hypothetical protein
MLDPAKSCSDTLKIIDFGMIPFFLILERDLSLLLPFSQNWEKGLGDEGVNYLSHQF